jgi:uncharacterized protein with HEPN domain
VTDEVAKALDAAERVVAVCDVLADMTRSGFDSFAGDLRSHWAVEMELIRIGEGVNRIPADVLHRFSDRPWRQIVAMRSFAAHEYDDLDPHRVWRTVTQKEPRAWR